MSRSLCISASPSQSTVSRGGITDEGPVDGAGSWGVASLVGLEGRFADGRVGLGARISRRRFAIVISSAADIVSEYEVVVDDGVEREDGEGESSS